MVKVDGITLKLSELTEVHSPMFQNMYKNEIYDINSVIDFVQITILSIYELSKGVLRVF